jgi:hypothetical protein
MSMPLAYTNTGPIRLSPISLLSSQIKSKLTELYFHDSFGFRLKKFKKPVHDEFGECSKKATTVPMHAQCLSDLINGKFDGSKYYNEVGTFCINF